MPIDLNAFFIAPTDTIRAAMDCIDRNAKGIALVVDGERRLLGTITDGDIRRAILANVDLDRPARALLERRILTLYPAPITAPAGTPAADLLRLMTERAIRHVPLLDAGGRVVDLALLSDLVGDYELPLQAVIMAGGKGTRLRPLTEDLPKPMLPVGDRPLMERNIERLREAGIRRINITTNYLAEKVTAHFGDGAAFGVAVNYVTEDQPLGTAGALGLMPPSDEPLLVMNGDLLTNVDFRAMFDYHKQRGAKMTVGVRKYEFTVPYGVVESAGDTVQRLVEKPSYSFFINAGIYLLEPSVHGMIPSNAPMQMTDVITRLVEKNQPVVSFPIREYWLDIGQLPDYRQALDDMEQGKV